MIEELRKSWWILVILFTFGITNIREFYDNIKFIKDHPIIINIAQFIAVGLLLSIIYFIFIWVWDLKKTSKHIYTDKIIIQPSTRNLTLKTLKDENNADILKSEFGFVISCYGKTKEDLKGILELSYPPDLTLIINDPNIVRSRRGYIEKKIVFTSKPEFIDIQGIIVKSENLSNFDNDHDRKIRICVKSINQGNAILDSCEVNVAVF